MNSLSRLRWQPPQMNKIQDPSGKQMEKSGVAALDIKFGILKRLVNIGVFLRPFICIIFD